MKANLPMIESLQNEKIKHVTRLLSDNRFRKKSGLFAVEGQQENTRAQQFGFESEEFYICEGIFKAAIPQGKVHFVSEKVYEKLAYRGTSEGIIGIYQTKNALLEDFQPKPDSAVIILEGIEKPGNLGAILRSCEAFGIDGLVITDPKVDFYNPNVIRSSVGCLFGMNVFAATNESAVQFLERNKFNIYTTMMSAEAGDLFAEELTARSAMVFGTEHSGLSEFWENIGRNTLIPMSGTIDSLNLSNAVAITAYEISRQKLQARP
nr:TrmH family RNA methyltransferase [Kaistella sp. Ran72]